MQADLRLDEKRVYGRFFLLLKKAALLRLKRNPVIINTVLLLNDRNVRDWEEGARLLVEDGSTKTGVYPKPEDLTRMFVDVMAGDEILANWCLGVLSLARSLKVLSFKMLRINKDAFLHLAQLVSESPIENVKVFQWAVYHDDSEGLMFGILRRMKGLRALTICVGHSSYVPTSLDDETALSHLCYVDLVFIKEDIYESLRIYSSWSLPALESVRLSGSICPNDMSTFFDAHGYKLKVLDISNGMIGVQKILDTCTELVSLVLDIEHLVDRNICHSGIRRVSLRNAFRGCNRVAEFERWHSIMAILSSRKHFAQLQVIKIVDYTWSVIRAMDWTAERRMIWALWIRLCNEIGICVVDMEEQVYVGDLF